jgi:hypothetical protein
MDILPVRRAAIVQTISEEEFKEILFVFFSEGAVYRHSTGYMDLSKSELRQRLRHRFDTLYSDLEKELAER